MVTFHKHIYQMVKSKQLHAVFDFSSPSSPNTEHMALTGSGYYIKSLICTYPTISKKLERYEPEVILKEYSQIIRMAVFKSHVSNVSAFHWVMGLFVFRVLLVA